MLQLQLADKEFYDDRTNRFILIEGRTLSLEHSLLSVSRWESKWCKPFLKPGYELTKEEMLDYIRCMSLDDIDQEVYYLLNNSHIDKISEYISLPMTATTFNDRGGAPSREIVTAEIIYFWMISFGIPLSCEVWHLNRLLTLIKVCNIKNQPAKKMTRGEQLAQQKLLNSQRRNALGTKG